MRRIVFSIILILAIAGIAWFFIANKSQNFSEDIAYTSIPIRTPLLIEIPDFDSFLEKLDDDIPIVKELKPVTSLQSFWEDVNRIKSLADQYDQFEKIINDKSVLIAFNTEGKNNIGCLYSFSLKNQSESEKLINLLNEISSSKNGSLSTKNYSNTDIYSYAEDEAEYFFAAKDGVFLFSRYELFIEEAIRQVSAENLLTQKEFESLYSTIDESSDINLFVNYETIPQFITRITNTKYNQFFEQLNTFANWTELNTTIDKSGISFHGNSSSNLADDNYLDIFRDQEASRFHIDQVLPANISMFANINLEDFTSFQTSFEEYLKAQGAYYTRETKLRELERYSNEPFISIFQGIAGNEYAVAFGQILQNEPSANRFFIAEVKGQTTAREAIVPILQNFAERNEMNFSDMQSNIETTNDKSYIIYQFPFKNIADLLLGRVFSAVDCNYLCFYNNYLVFSDNSSALAGFIQDLDASRTLEKDPGFRDLNNKMNARSSFYFYLNLSQGYSLGDYYLKDKPAQLIRENESVFRNFDALGWQFSANSEAIQNNLYLKYNPDLEENPQIVWQSKMDGEIMTSPKIVQNHTDTENNEVILQDEKNNLYLISSNGEVRWQLQLPSQIMSDIHQVDIYRNRRLQYLFNTKDKLYLIDRNGNNVENYPIELDSPATNGVAVFDYDNSRNYRFFIACENKNIYVFNNEGDIVSGWQPEETNEIVTNPIKHFRVNNKDYIVLNDRNKTYILDRQGNVRVNVADNFPHSENETYLVEGDSEMLASTDMEGKVHLQHFNGQSDIIDLGNYSSSHYFLTDDLNNDGKTDFLIADEDILFCYTDKGKQIFEYKLDDEIEGKPLIYTSPTNTKVIVLSSRNEVYLLTATGDLLDGFPLTGGSKIYVGDLDNENEYFNVLTNNNRDVLLNYKIKP